MSLEPIIIGALLIVITSGAITVRRMEKSEWNGGISAKSGEPWISTDIASEGSRYYTDGEGNSCWISYNVDKGGYGQSNVTQIRNPYQCRCRDIGSVSDQRDRVRSGRDDN